MPCGRCSTPRNSFIFINVSVKNFTTKRKSHHDECSKFFCKEISNDITEAENLDIILKTKYPNLKYSIVLLLVCGKCYQPDDIYKPTSSNITIHNIAMDPGANEPVENKFVELFVYK